MPAGGTARAQVAGRKLVATTAQVGDLLRAVVGEAGADNGATVESLLGEGIDPHTYKLTRSDTVRLLAADAIFYNGLLLEGKMADALQRLAADGRPVTAVGDALPRERLLQPAGFEGSFDPHIWMDVSLWRAALAVVRDRLSQLYPQDTARFHDNAAAFDAVLDRLDGYARTVLGSVPAPQRVLVTAHDAFSYLGRAYGVEVVGIQGISTESEAGLRRIEELVALLADRKVPAVFVETSVSERNVRALVDGAAARGHTVAIGGSLYSDAMGAPGSYEGTYVGMIDHNVTTIARALGGEAPAGGFQGRLPGRA
ncbi:periplasmic zinc-binding protein TroA [Rhodospirillum centenum SW]|uniref:Periplasmic zinc-binding protein TroA n=1 Tax=Rhodospirillum centenum (strain ATCC 51521 / SW) TaxID=414684 RepID=B6IUL7_RHOCS|nr:periplasmic zinc-binding protein TroA [Rhodospirillum centenum SW]